MPQCLISLGSNVGDSERYLRSAVEQLRRHEEIGDVALSRLHSTAPVGGPASQRVFLNAAARLTTSLGPLELFEVLLQIERSCGRQRGERWGPRTLDLDLLLYDEVVLHAPRLTVPHPRMAVRRFVLLPAAEVAPDMRHPLIGWTVQQLCEHLLSAPPYVAITGRNADAASRLAREVAPRAGWTLVPRPSLRGEAVELAGQRRRRVEFIEAAAARLPDLHVGSVESPRLSDFWIAEALLDCPEEIRPHVEQAYAAVAGSVLPPKLLATEAPEALETSALSTGQAAGEASNPKLDLESLLQSHYEGPILQLPNNPTEAADEIVAALHAMQGV